MFDYVAHYQFGFFAPGSHVDPTADNIGLMLDTFKDKGFIPTSVPELVIGPGAGNSSMLQLNTKMTDWILAFEPHRVLLTHNKPKSTELVTIDEFIVAAEEIFSRLLSKIPLKGTRLSYVTKGLLHKMSSGELAEVNNKLLNLPAFYREHLPCEWATRNVSRVDVDLSGKTEKLNVVTDINRIQGTIANKEGLQGFDRIEIGFDINTFHKNTSMRFGQEDVGVFLREAVGISHRILAEIQEVFGG